MKVYICFSLLLTSGTTGFTLSSPPAMTQRSECKHFAGLQPCDNEDTVDRSPLSRFLKEARHTIQATAFTLALSLSSVSAPALAADSSAIVGCLFTKCQVPLTKCIANPKCLANVACINTCNGRPDEIGCQIKCGDLFENSVVGEFNKCAITTMGCVPQKQDAGEYPVPSPENLVSSFDTKLFSGRWYISAGQNPLFDTFPCQVHFFENPKPGVIFGKLNWRIQEPDGEFFTRDAVQRFVQDKKQPALLMNHDNDYLHYQDDWYIVDYEYDDNADGVPPFAFVYYRGSNDAWDGYGGAVVYTRAAAMPESIIPRLRVAAQKVGMDFDKDFALTDNSCPTEPSEGEKIIMRERFAGNVVLQSERQLQAQATLLRGNAANVITDETKLVGSELQQATKAVTRLEQRLVDFEKEIVKDAESLEKVIEKDVKGIEQEIEKDVKGIEKELEKDVKGIFGRR